MSDHPITVVCQRGNSTVTPESEHGVQRDTFTWNANSNVTLVFRDKRLFGVDGVPVLRGQPRTLTVQDGTPPADYPYDAYCHISADEFIMLEKVLANPIIIIDA